MRKSKCSWCTVMLVAAACGGQQVPSPASTRAAEAPVESGQRECAAPPATTIHHEIDVEITGCAAVEGKPEDVVFAVRVRSKPGPSLQLFVGDDSTWTGSWSLVIDEQEILGGANWRDPRLENFVAIDAEAGTTLRSEIAWPDAGGEVDVELSIELLLSEAGHREEREWRLPARIRRDAAGCVLLHADPGAPDPCGPAT